MNPAYISALSALAGAAIGGLTSFVTSWLTLRTQLRHVHREAEKAKLEALYGDFIAEATRLFAQPQGQLFQHGVPLGVLSNGLGRPRKPISL